MKRPASVTNIAMAVLTCSQDTESIFNWAANAPKDPWVPLNPPFLYS